MARFVCQPSHSNVGATITDDITPSPDTGGHGICSPCMEVANEIGKLAFTQPE